MTDHKCNITRKLLDWTDITKFR